MLDDDPDLDDLRPRLPPVPPAMQPLLDEMLEKVRKPLGPGEPRRHHFIPQFFLKRFATKDGQLAVLRLAEPDEYDVTNIVNLAVMRDLYTTVDPEIGETAAVEKLLAVADGEAKAAIDRIAFGALFPPSPADRSRLSFWLSLLYVRDPYTRRIMEALADQTVKLDVSLARDPDVARARLREQRPGEEPDDADVDALVQFAADLNFELTPHQNDLVGLMLDGALTLVPFFYRRLYSVVRFPEPGLLLSDRPIVLQGNEMPWLQGVGPGNAREVWLPLDRRTALVLHNDRKTGEVIFNAPLALTIDRFNQPGVANAHRELYFHPDDVDRLDGTDLPDQDAPLLNVTLPTDMHIPTDGVNEPPTRTRHRRYRRSD